MPTPGLFPILLKASAGAGGAAGVVYIETFGLETLEMTNVEVIDLDIDIEVLEQTPDIEVLEVIDVEIVC